MGLEELKSSLHALKQLYGLLRKDENGLPNSTSNMLDDKSRLLLKDLLDRAAENVSKIHCEVLGSQVGSSFTDGSERAQQLGDLQTQLPATKKLDVLQICGKDQNVVEFTELDNDGRFREKQTRRLTSMQPTLSVASSEFGSRYKYCRVCQRRIFRHPMESASCDTRNGAKSNALLQPQNCEPNSFLCGEENEIQRSPIGSPESFGSAEDREQRESTQFDSIWSGIGSTDDSSNKPADGVESGPLHELTEEIPQGNERLSCLSKQASDAIKQIEHQILDLQREAENSETYGRSPAVPMSFAAQQEVSDRMKDIASQAEKPLMVTRNVPSKSEFSAIGVNDWQLETDNRQCKGTGLWNQLPMEMVLPKLNDRSPLKLLPLKKTMTNPYDEIKRQNHLRDWSLGQTVKSNAGKIQPEYVTASDCPNPSHLHNSYCFSSEDNKISKRVPASVTRLPRQFSQAVFEENITKQGACPVPKQCRTHIDSRHKVNQFSGSQSKKDFPGEIKKWQPSLQHNADKYPARRTLYHQHESDSSLRSNPSKWKSQQTSTSYSESEEYYPTSSENDMYSLSGDDSQARYEGLSSSDSEVYSWQSSDRTYKTTSRSRDERKGKSLPYSASSSQASYSDHSETEGCSSYNQPRSRRPREISGGSTSTKKIRPTGAYAASRRTNSAKNIGKWKKLKDKLCIIFHHHHHHHHHLHHADDNEDRSNRKNRKIHGKLPSKMRPGDDENDSVEKIGKAVIHGRDSKKKHKPVNALIGGLFKHVRHSKRSKLSAKHIKPFRDDEYDGNKATARLNWLKMLQRHRKAKKLGIGYRKR